MPNLTTGDYNVKMCGVCGNSEWACTCWSNWLPQWKPTFDTFPNQPRQGWQCPHCKTVYAPWWAKCECQKELDVADELTPIQAKQAQIVSAMVEMSEDEIDELLESVETIQKWRSMPRAAASESPELPSVSGTLSPPVIRPEFGFEED